jgi:hypothetical protein
MCDLENLAFMNLHLVSFPRHARPCGDENYDFREPDGRGMSRLLHTLDECNLEHWELYELRKYGLKSLDEFAALIVPLYSKKEVANMAADYLWRDIMSVIPKMSHYKGEVADFLVQDCFQMDDEQYKECLDKAENTAMEEWMKNKCQPDDMESVFECAKKNFLKHGPDTIPDVILARYAVATANNIVVDILKSA